MNQHNKLYYIILNTINKMYRSPNEIVVFDIDYTLINGQGLPINQMIALYKIILQKGINIAIITARTGSPHNVEKTKEELSRYGINNYKYLYFLPEGQNDPWIYKYNARKQLHDHGWNVITSIGDEPWDIGQYGGVGFIVPK
jgi:hypothetical protein